ncbi:MAG: aquaporin [Gammaproteobacteria bacterium]|nr:aquaporin [Gammaproteobacteria bacterium]
MTPTSALREHWPEYLIEGWALGTFMVSAGIVATLLGAPASPVHRALSDPMWRQGVGGIAMGLTAIALIHSPWGKRSGAHMNPAVTLTFLRLGKIRPWDALFFVIAQVVGGASGVLLVAALAGHAFSDPPVSYAATLPGSSGPAAAFVAEFVISAVLMLTVLSLTATARLAPYTGLIVGGLVALYITFESPLSGMSMNPARSLASAAPGMLWHHLWIYLTAPLLGMLSGAQLFLMVAGARRVLCAKLLHPLGVACIHCGYEPPQAAHERSAAEPGSVRA